MRRFLDRLYRACGWIAAAFIAAICLLVSAQVLLNSIDRVSTLLTGSAIGLTIPSYADITGFFLAGASFFALAFTLNEGGHIRVSLVVHQVPPRFRRAFEIWAALAGGAAALYFTWYSSVLCYQSYLYGDVSSGMVAVPLWLPQSVMPLGLGVLSIALLDALVTLLKGALPAYAHPAQAIDTDEGALARSVLDGE
ncbi:TRAP transporter small permease [Varunaivibrio sulfuroxidans]|uniref:TRAP transporter small permease protein n=1 Tax=Varunaivibrio sulfuroxidans TaxID=1773489 RepID=A0A4R3JC40_9PROT|nr:TRAP transporter small permease [Varunaivibrio sulfuroxidans]TCS62915.1 TRAP-type C4-dicarboxylate transport system permease small subunit [Varunaivibrio sulfuroxidans]WES32006.1 TRAP transporter small permease [Varunaivibrio sulfuroxidans]